MNPNNGTHNSLGLWPRPLCFVMAGGGSYGATHVGMIRALVEAGITPDLVVGTSVGAFNGVRVSHDPKTAADALTSIWKQIDRRTVFGSNSRFGAVLHLARSGFGRRSVATCAPDHLGALIDSQNMPATIEELSIPTGIVVTDLLAGKPKVLRSGKLKQSLLASAAIPGVFPPVQLEGCWYVDGGVAANVPIRQAIAVGAKSMVILNCNPSGMPNRLPNNLVEMGMHASIIMQRNQIAGDMTELASRYPILQMPQTTPTDTNSFDFSRSSELIERSFDSSQQFLKDLPSLTDTTRRI